MAEGNILVIDDELVICEFLSDLLKDREYTVKYALSGRDGLKAFGEDNFDVVMVDLKIPDIDGIKLLGEIKGIDPDSIIIVMTGYPSFETVQSALRLGAYDYLTKPVDINEISFVIKRAVAFRNLARTNKKLMQELGEQNIKLEEKVKERTEELTLLYKIGLDISSILNLDEVLGKIVDRISAVLDLEVCSILLIENKSDELRIRAACGLNKEIISQTRVKVGDLISGWIAEHKEAVLVEDIETDSRFIRRNQEKYYTHSFISVPLLVKNEIIGVINANNKRSRQPFTEDDFRFIRGIANVAAIAVENARLYTSLEDIYLRTVMALTLVIDAKDHYTKIHSEHVTKYASAIARELGLSEKEIGEIKQAALLHDLG
ncbi:MAG: response regulator, partial [Candidatus Desantisbacteria bacterium]